MRPLTFNTGVFDYLDREESEEVMLELIETLVRLNRAYLRRHPETPSLYRSGVRYLREGTVEEFCTIPSILKTGASDCEDLAAWRVAELQEREGEAGAKIDVQSADSRDGMGRAFKLYHVRVRRADGKIEDPSAILGMRRVVPNGWNPIPGVATEVAEVGAKLVRLYHQGSDAARGFIERMHELSDQGDAHAHRLLVLLKRIDDFESAQPGSDD